MKRMLAHTDTTDRNEKFESIPELPGGTFTAPLARPNYLHEDWLEPQQRKYTHEDDHIWDDLFARQMEILPGRACSAFLEGLKRLDLGKGGVPDFGEMSEELSAITGWQVVPVPMLIPDHVFFYHLANRRFPAGNFIRTRDTFDYIQEPDVFHDVFGHVPLLTDPVFADYMAAYGRAGWKALHHNRLKALSALYWYTVEFGLMREESEMRAYGAGILSGPTEAVFAVEAKSPNRIHLDVDRVMRTDYVISDLQPTYFVIDSFDELFAMTVDRNFDDIYASIDPGFTHANMAVLGNDKVYQKGTQEYALRGGAASHAEPV